MKIKKIYYSTHFLKALKKFSRRDLKIVSEREKIFRENCFDKRLKTHKLRGSLKGYWTFSITYSLRILFEFISENEVFFYDVGPHSIYK